MPATINTTAKKITVYGFIVRTGGGLPEQIHGMFSQKADAEEVSAEDKAEGYEPYPATNFRNAQKKVVEFNRYAEQGGHSCKFELIKVADESPEYRRLYSLYLANYGKPKMLFA